MSNSHIDNLVNAVVNKISAVVNNHNSSSNAHSSLLSDYLQTTDVKDNLTSNNTDQPLSAKQGKELKTLIDSKEDKSNKVTSISSSSTDTEYPSAKVVYDTIEPKLAKSDTKTLGYQYSTYGIYNSWKIDEVFGGQEMANEVTIYDDRIVYMNFSGRLKFTNNTPKQISLELTLGFGNGSENYYSFDKINYIDLSSTTTTITLESDEFVYLYCENGNSLVTYSVRSNKNSIGTIVDMIYPVGSIYMNVNPTDPQILFGGTWTRLKDRFLLGSGDTYTNGATGGEATHTLTTNEMPSHTHIQNSHNHSQNAHSHYGKYDDNSYVMSETTSASNKRVTAVSSGSVYVDTAGSAAFHHYNNTGSTTATNNSQTATNQNTGGGQAHNNMPPYMSVYMWKRTA